MAEEQPSLHIDTDWKKQAQEEKRRLSEQEEKRRAAAATTAAAPPSASSPTAPPPGSTAATDPRRGAGPASAATGRERQLPPATFTTLVQSIVTQILYYLGELGARGAEPMLNLDMAKHNIDLLGIIEEKTRGNLTEDERRLLDGALYEARMRYVAVASQFATV